LTNRQRVDNLAGHGKWQETIGMAAFDSTSALTTDIVAKLTDAIENLDSIPSDEMLVVLNEALDVIRELVQMLDKAETR